MVIDHERPGRWSVLRNRPLLFLMLGHFIIDSFSGLLPVLFPLLITRFSLDFKTVGLVSLAYTGMASLVQPLFGWIADRYGTRWIGLALVWTALTFAAIGFVPSFALILLFAGAAGIGSGAYHPLGALNASAVISPRQRNTAMSIYVTAGTVGFALGPLIGSALFSTLGSQGTLFMLLPGLAVAGWLLIEARRLPQRVQQTRVTTAPRAPLPLIPLLMIIGVMMSRSWTVLSIQAFVPSWYKTLGYGESFYGPLATTLMLSGALGTVATGALADRYGRRALILGTLVLTIPALLLFAEFTGPIAFPLAVLLGLSAGSSTPLLLVMAQELLSRRAGMASGLILGLGFVAGAVGIPITGAIADSFGMEVAIQSQVLLVLVTIGMAALIPSEASFRERAEE